MIPVPASFRYGIPLSDTSDTSLATPPIAARTRATPAPARIVAFCLLPGGPFDTLLAWLASRGAKLTAMPIRSLSFEWFDRYANSFDAALIDADFLGDDGTMIDFGLRLRRFAPYLPIIVLSSRVTRSDYSTERMAICDVTLRTPLTASTLLDALAIAEENHDQWHESRFGRMQSR